MNWQAVFFDFDGVIIDSAPIKTAAFAHLFRPYGPDVEKALVAYHLSHQGISRYEKFRYAFARILKQPVAEGQLAALNAEFSLLVLDSVLNAPYLPGVLDTLNELRSLNIPAFVASGTPKAELEYIIRERKVQSYFKGVFGAPRQKSEIIRYVIKREHFSPSKCLFIGDSLTDYHAAQKTNTKFIGIVPTNQSNPFPANVITKTTVRIA